MSKLTGFKRVVACTAAVLICASVFSGAGSSVINAEKAHAASSKLKENQEEIAGDKQSIDELIAKQEELDKKIAETKDDISAEEENKKAIEEQIVTVQETIMTLSTSISETQDEIKTLESSISEKEVQVEEKHEQIVEGVGDFKERLKAMYVAGNNSYSDIIIGASDFYDMLMKMELVKRVAEHDDKMIDDLIVLKDQYEADEAELNAEKAELEAKQADLETKKEAHEKQRDKLQVLFTQSEINLEEMSSNKQIYENNLAMIEQEKEQFQKHLDELYMERMAINAEEKKKADEEKARQEEERRRQEEERRKKEEEERLEAERKRQEEAKKAAEQQANNNNNGSTDNDNNESGNSGGSNENDNSGGSTEKDDNGSGNTGNGGSDDNSKSDVYIPPTASDNLSKNAQYGYTDISRLTWPVPGHYKVTFGFGMRNSGVLVGNHKGIDIYDGNIYNAEIVAADAGTVIDVSNYCPHDYGKSYSCGCGGGYGRYCIIDHGDGLWTLYGHANNIVVSVGQTVEKGQVIGYVGSTGHSTGPHTHFEVQVPNPNGWGMMQVDPISYVTYSAQY